jgi:hypothetical protein
MKRMTTLALLSLSLFACSSGESTDTDEGPPPIELRRDVDPGPSPWDQPTGQISKSIHYADFNTVKGTTYMSGALIVDHVLAQDGEDVFSVNVRVRNTTDKLIRGDYLIEFRTRNLEQISGHKRAWEPFVVESHGLVVLSNSALIRGAVGFKLFITNKDAEVKPQQGQPDPRPGQPDVPKPPVPPTEEPKKEPATPEPPKEEPKEPPKEEPKEPPKEEPKEPPKEEPPMPPEPPKEEPKAPPK